MKQLTLGSLFDGIGGWLLDAEHNGIKPIWSSEIDPFPMAVSKYHFPNVKQLGDITKINVDELEPVDIICAGSPCQDLSVAGKREGLAGERSGLFRTAVELVHRLRDRTGLPRYFVWENVPGAFSSNKGLDFRAVLEEITKTEIPMPKYNKWADSGMVEWGGGSLAWRVLDAQYWGVPQRRKRIFLVADFGGRSAGEILFESQGVPRDSAESERKGEEVAGNVRKSIDSASGTLTPWDVQSNRIQSVNGKAAALYGGAGQGTHNGAIFDTRKAAYSFDGLASNSMKSKNPHSGCRQVEVAKCLDTTVPDPSKNQGGIAIYDISHRQDVIRPQGTGTLPCLTARAGTGGNNLPVVHSYCIAGNTIDRQPQNGGNGTGNQEELSYTLNTVDRHAVAECFPQNAYDKFLQGKPLTTLKASGGSYGGGSENLIANISPTVGKVRRLTPTELRIYLQEVDINGATQGIKALYVLWENYGAKKVCEWCIAIMERIQQAKVLQQGVYEKSVSTETSQGNELDDSSLPCPEYIADWLLRDMWQQQKCGCAPQRWEPAEQFARKLNASVQKLSHKNPSPKEEMYDMWEASKGSWLLREAFTEIQKIWESFNVESWRQTKTVRRLTPLEAERLQGLPDGYTDIEFNGKPAPDSRRYKAIGNGMAQPCADYILECIIRGYEKEQKEQQEV